MKIVLFFLPLLLFLSVSASLATLAEQTSQDVDAFALDMQASLDCAFEARPLEQCSSTLLEHDFEKKSQEALQKIQEEVERLEQIGQFD